MHACWHTRPIQSIDRSTGYTVNRHDHNSKLALFGLPTQNTASNQRYLTALFRNDSRNTKVRCKNTIFLDKSATYLNNGNGRRRKITSIHKHRGIIVQQRQHEISDTATDFKELNGRAGRGQFREFARHPVTILEKNDPRCACKIYPNGRIRSAIGVAWSRLRVGNRAGPTGRPLTRAALEGLQKRRGNKKQDKT